VHPAGVGEGGHSASYAKPAKVKFREDMAFSLGLLNQSSGLCQALNHCGQLLLLPNVDEAQCDSNHIELKPPGLGQDEQGLFCSCSRSRIEAVSTGAVAQLNQDPADSYVTAN